jgi:hypothetical protein
MPPLKRMAFCRLNVAVFPIGIVLAFSAAGCSGSNGGSRVPAAGGPDLGAPDVPWHGKNRDERRAFMGAHVEPTMRHLFQEFDKKNYADFSCETCHGPDMETVDFKMPNGLYTLSDKDTLEEAASYDKTTTNFMTMEVVPAFAKLLADKPSDPGGAGVSCFTCHPHE